MSQKAFPFQKLKLARILMLAAILLIVAFQAYWLNRLYHDERNGLAKEANTIFRETVYNLQVDRLKNDTLFYHSINRPNVFVYNAMNVMRNKVAEIKRDSAKAAAALKDTTTRMIFFGDPGKIQKDSGAKKPTIIIRGTGGDIPPEVLQQMIRKQMETSSQRKDSTKDQTGMGMGLTMVINETKFPPVDSHSSKITSKDLAFERKVAAALGVKPRTTTSTANLRVQFDRDHPERSFATMIADGKLIRDTISVTKLDSAFHKELAKNNIRLSFKLNSGKEDSLHRKDSVPPNLFVTRPATVGLVDPHWYQAEFENPARFILGKITPQILFSVFLVAFTTIAFIFLYRNLAAQRRLTEIKNDFISNITHELKTPIATVSVAVEALRNFGGIQSPERTKEYLDISAAELQRLGLLVDKVLKLSLFESRELDLKKEPVDLKELLQEVLNTMKLQFDKMHATLHLEVQGNYFLVNGDRLHLTSVIYNLLDNALKYSKDKPDITVHLRHDTDNIILSVADKGIGIPAGFTGKIFDKFFRVPTGDHHNIKGYGLGLSYVAHVVQKHDGNISVESEPGKGSTFTVKLPIA